MGYVFLKNDGYVKKCGLAIQVMKIGCIKGDVLPLAETLGQVFWGDKECLFQCKGKTFEHLLFLEQIFFLSLSDRLSQLTYCIRFGTLMAKGILPAETTFF